MINQEEHEFLKRIADMPGSAVNDQEIDYGSPLVMDLREQGRIDPCVDERTGEYVCRVTAKGVAAIEEYEQNQRQQEREAEALALSQEDTALSREANALSKEANGLSRRANRIALWALAISFAALVVSVVALFK